MQAFESKYWQEGIDSKALLVCFLQKLPYLLLVGVAGAVLGSGLYLLIAVMTSQGTKYQAETEYYIDFAEGRLEAKDYYNDFTWNDVMATDLILGNTMESLGASYDRAAVKEMITADILSDVRYLTITVEGSDEAAVEAVSNATKISLEQFGSRMEEFDSIEQIENNGVEQEKKKLFTWRAAFLGALAGIFAASFCLVSKFCLGSSFYTKHAISQCFSIPVFGLFYAKQNQKQGAQEMALQLALQHRMKDCKGQVVLLDVCQGDYAKKCREELQTLYTKEQLGSDFIVQGCFVQGMQDFDRMREAEGVILVIPFAKPCREAVMEKLDELQNQECRVLGAVLADVDKKWMKRYGIH